MNKKVNIADKYYGHDELVDSLVASRIIGFAPRTIRDMATKRILPIYKIGPKTIRYKVSDMLEWVEKRRIVIN